MQIRFQLSVVFLFFTLLDLNAQENLQCGFQKIQQGFTKSNQSCDSNPWGEDAEEFIDFLTTFDLNTTEIKYIPIEVYIIRNTDDPTNYNSFIDIENRVKHFIKVTNNDFRGKRTDTDDFYGYINPNSVDSKIRFVLPNTTYGNCNGPFHYIDLNQSEYDDKTLAGGGIQYHKLVDEGYIVGENINTARIYLNYGATSTGSPFTLDFVSGPTQYIVPPIGAKDQTSITHELGHMLFLAHTFADPPGSAFGYIYPNQETLSQSHPIEIGNNSFDPNLNLCRDPSDNCLGLDYTDHLAYTLDNCISDIPTESFFNTFHECGEDPVLIHTSEIVKGALESTITASYYIDLNVNVPNNACSNSYVKTIKFYNPARNFMSYNNCRIEFSPNQIEWMHYHLEDREYFTDILAASTFPQDSGPISNVYSSSNLADLGIIIGDDYVIPSGFIDIWNCDKTIIGELVVQSGTYLLINNAKINFWDENSCITVEEGGQFELRQNSCIEGIVDYSPYSDWIL